MFIISLTQFFKRLITFCFGTSIIFLSSCSRNVDHISNQQPSIISDTTQPKKNKPVSPRSQQLKVALLIPITGQHRKLGLAVEQAAEMALFTKNIAQFNLAIYDTQSTIEGAQTAMNKALHEKCNVIVGPIFTNEVKAVKSLANKRAVPILSLSNNIALADRYTYILGLSPVDQTRTILEYAVENGRQQIVTLLPQNQLGHEIATEIQQDPPLSEIIYYDPQRLTSLQPLINKIHNNSVSALFIPEGGTALARIISALVYAEVNLTNLQFLGSSLWDEPITHNNITLNHAWITNTNLISYQKFESEFKKTYGYVPSRIASVGYDAVTLLLTAKKHFNDQATSVENLTDPRGYAGVNGAFKLTSNGLVKRSYEIIKFNKINESSSKSSIVIR